MSSEAIKWLQEWVDGELEGVPTQYDFLELYPPDARQIVAYVKRLKTQIRKLKSEG